MLIYDEGVRIAFFPGAFIDTCYSFPLPCQNQKVAFFYVLFKPGKCEKKSLAEWSAHRLAKPVATK
jgi:hypothetical protein